MRDGVTKRATGKHLARFMLVGFYTGTRHAAICGAALQSAIGRGYVDLDHGVFHRRAQGARETKKRQPPVFLPNPTSPLETRGPHHVGNRDPPPPPPRDGLSESL